MFKALFSIHDNLIRLKTGETVPDDSTNGKATLYDNMNKVVGFKIDIRFLFDYDGYEFDLGAAEVCVPGSLDQKINDDLAKLLREGKDNTDGLHKATFRDKGPPYSWILQIVGLTNHMSSVHYVGHQLNVGVFQKTINFPNSVIELSSGKDFLYGLFRLRDSMEKYAHKIRNNLVASKSLVNKSSKKLSNSSTHSPPRLKRSLSLSLSQTWFTPPRNDCSISVFANSNRPLLSTIMDDVDEVFFWVLRTIFKISFNFYLL